MTDIFVTGAGGFVGRHTMWAAGRGFMAFAAQDLGLPGLGDPRARRDLVAGTTSGLWRERLQGREAILHLAGRAHGRPDDTAEAFEHDNADLTAALARVAADAGVGRFVFLSTIGVNGTSTDTAPFNPDSPPHPSGPYGVSKWHAEQRLWTIARETGLEVTVVRPPLIYGAGAPGNIARLAAAVRRGWPMPFGAVRNRRQLMNVTDLAELLVRCAWHPAAAGRVFLAADAEPVSTPDVIRALAEALGRSPRLLPVPPSWLALGARIARRPQLIEQLLRSLEIDIDATTRRLDWTPRHGLREGLAAMAAAMTVARA